VNKHSLYCVSKLEVRNLTKRFDGSGKNEIVAVDDLSINIEDGDFLVLVGPSGCGKSTTLRCIAGLENVTEGEIYIDDEPVSGKKPKDRDIAMVFQNYALYPHKTAHENIAFGLQMSTDLSQKDIDLQVERVAQIMGIENLLDQKPGELSGGQQQRVALGRAIVRDPKAFLMDEPLSNLDAKLRTQMRTELQDLQQELGVTTIYVTHDQTEAMTMGDQIAILNRGKLQQIGTPLECYHKPANRFVAGFIGSPSMNFFDSVVQRRDRENVTLEHKSFTYQIPSEMLESSGSDKVTLGIRPSDIQVESEKGQETVSAKVNVTEPLGEIIYVHVDIGGDQYTVNVDGEKHVEENEQLPLLFPRNRIHLFDGTTGKVITNRELSKEGGAPLNV